MKTHVKRGEEVVVIRGASRGKRGKLLDILSKKNRGVVEGVAMIKRHEKKTQENPEGAIVEREGSIHLSNLMRATTFDARQQKSGVAKK
ncbi:MAG: 50S ribosomal protein L24 [Opitutaceae bacterium]|nr:50S ribosomal protein L24 [Opitutaceae bacterium]